MFVRNGAVTPGLSHECATSPSLLRDDQNLRDNTVAARRVQSVTIPSSRVSRECRSPGLRSPPFKNARQNIEEKSAEKSAQESAHQNQRKHLYTKDLHAKSRFEHSFSLEDGSQEKHLRQTCAMAQPHIWMLP